MYWWSFIHEYIIEIKTQWGCISEWWHILLHYTVWKRWTDGDVWWKRHTYRLIVRSPECLWIHYSLTHKNTPLLLLLGTVIHGGLPLSLLYLHFLSTPQWHSHFPRSVKSPLLGVYALWNKHQIVRKLIKGCLNKHFKINLQMPLTFGHQLY